MKTSTSPFSCSLIGASSVTPAAPCSALIVTYMFIEEKNYMYKDLRVTHNYMDLPQKAIDSKSACVYDFCWNSQGYMRPEKLILKLILSSYGLGPKVQAFQVPLHFTLCQSSVHVLW